VEATAPQVRASLQRFASETVVAPRASPGGICGFTVATAAINLNAKGGSSVMSVKSIRGGFVLEIERSNHLFLKLGRFEVFCSLAKDNKGPAGRRIVFSRDVPRASRS
jgi:hypothetical protein